MNYQNNKKKGKLNLTQMKKWPENQQLLRVLLTMIQNQMKKFLSQASLLLYNKDIKPRIHGKMMTQNNNLVAEKECHSTKNVFKECLLKLIEITIPDFLTLTELTQMSTCNWFKMNSLKLSLEFIQKVAMKMF